MPRIRSGIAVLLVLTLSLLTLSSCDGSSDAAFQTNTQRTGVYNTKGPHSSPSVAWKFKTGGEIRSSPTIVESIVYFGSGEGYLYALDASGGQLRWKLKTGAGVRSSPMVQDRVVYVGSDDGALYAADAKTGTSKWRSKTYGYFILLDEQGTCCEEYLKSNLRPPGIDYSFHLAVPFSGWGISASPVITGGGIYFADETAYFYAADVATGEILWVATDPYGSTSSAAADGNSIYFLSDGGNLKSLSTKTSQENWRFYTVDDFHNSAVVVADGSVYITGYLYRSLPDEKVGSTLWSVDSVTGKEKWRFQKEGRTTAPVVYGNRVYFTAGDHLYALDAQTGVKLWEFNRNQRIGHAPALADGILYLITSEDITSEDYMYAIDAGSGQEVWKVKTECAVTSPPAVADGMVYFGCDDGYLYALKSKGASVGSR